MWFLIIMIIPLAMLAILGDSFIKKKADDKNCEEGEIKYIADVSVIAKHVCGLPLGENSECKLYLSENQIVIESYGNIFKLEKNKIIDTSIKTSREVQNSISGAVGGLFY